MAEQRDDLTHLLNRGAFDAALAQGIANALENNCPLSLVFGDVDRFKNVNDTRGHQAGDAVLGEVAARLEHVGKGKGSVYRYGGEEIALILNNHSVDEALAVAERSRREIEKSPIAGIAVTMSFGVATAPDHATGAAELVASADKALYDAKDRGRNLVRFFGEPAPTRAGPRELDRRTPELGKLTDKQKAELRRRLLQRQAISCPEDGALLDVRDVTTHDSVGRDFMIHCPECGLTEELPSAQRAV